MKKLDFLWFAALAAALFFMLSPYTNPIYINVNSMHPYITGFFKFMILASMGELLTLRIIKGFWFKPCGMIYRAIVWGLIGMATALMFEVFAGGVLYALDKGLLPGGDKKSAFAFFTSVISNLAYAPTFMSFHKITDALIDLRVGEKKKASLGDAVRNVDWSAFVTFVVVKTLPLIWIPAHTLTFLLPSEYRVMSAALLSILMGALLAIPKKQKASKSTSSGNEEEIRKEI